MRLQQHSSMHGYANCSFACRAAGTCRIWMFCPEQLLLDLYTGTGTIALSLAAQCKAVTGVESVRSAVADARANAKQNAIHHAQFVQADLSSADELQRLASVDPDVVVAGVHLGISVV